MMFESQCCQFLSLSTSWYKLRIAIVSWIILPQSSEDVVTVTLVTEPLSSNMLAISMNRGLNALGFSPRRFDSIIFLYGIEVLFFHLENI